jgi:hypothetical protein
VAVERQLALIEHLEASDDAYRQAIRDCGLPDSARAVALWLLDHGRREIVEGVGRCQVAAVRSRAALAKAARVSDSAAGRGIKRLRRDGLVMEDDTGRHWVLMLPRVCAAGETRAMGRQTGPTIRIAADPSWTPGAIAAPEADDNPPRPPPVHPSFTPRSVPVHPSFSARSLLRRTEKEISKFPEILETETDNRFGAGERRVNDTERGVNGGERPANGRGPKAPSLHATKKLVNRSDAWQALQPEDFRTGDGNRRIPDWAKLRACFQVAVRVGLLRDDFEAKEKFLAAVHDVAHRTDNPPGALVYRLAAGKLHWAPVESFEWARRVLRGGQPQTEPSRPLAPLGEVLAQIAGGG